MNNHRRSIFQTILWPLGGLAYILAGLYPLYEIDIVNHHWSMFLKVFSHKEQDFFFYIYLLILAFEYTLFTSLITVITAIPSRLLRIPSFIACYLFFLGYFSTLIGSWFMFEANQIFLQPRLLIDAFAVVDVDTLLDYSTPKDKIITGLILGLISLLFLALTRLKAPHLRKIGIYSALLLPTAIGILTLSLLAPYAESTSPKSYRVYKQVQLQLAPQFSFYLPEARKELDLALNTKTLSPSYTVAAYKERIREAPRKNIFVFQIEALRADNVSLHVKGKEIMPTLNQMAQNGVFIPNAFTHSAETSWGQLAMILGQHPYRHEALADPFFNLQTQGKPPFSFLKLYDLMAQGGYKVAHTTYIWKSLRSIAGSPHIDLDFDFSTIHRGTHVGNLTSKKAIQALRTAGMKHLAHFTIAQFEALQNWIHTNKNDTLFSLSYVISSHFPYDTPDGNDDLFKGLPDIDPSNFLVRTPEEDKIIHYKYYNALRYIDDKLSYFLELLKKLEILKDSIIVITGDHGEGFGEHGDYLHGKLLYNEAIRIPIVIYDGGQNLTPSYLPQAAGLIDLPPTLLDLANLPETAAFQGSSILSDSRSTKCSPPIVSASPLVGEYAVINWPWKYISSELRLQSALYQLEDDPNEQNNLIDDHPEMTSQLANYLNEFRKSQFAYYSASTDIREKYFPPALPCLPK